MFVLFLFVFELINLYYDADEDEMKNGEGMSKFSAPLGALSGDYAGIAACQQNYNLSRFSSVSVGERRTRDRKVLGSSPRRRGGRFSFSFSSSSFFQSTFCADSCFGIRSIPRVSAVARKPPRSFCQKCRWQVSPKHTCIHMWFRKPKHTCIHMWFRTE